MKTIDQLYQNHRQEIETEIELQKKRIAEATQSGLQKVQQTLSVEKWIRRYPLQSVAILLAGGFIAAQLFYNEPPIEQDEEQPKEFEEEQKKGSRSESRSENLSQKKFSKHHKDDTCLQE